MRSIVHGVSEVQRRARDVVHDEDGVGAGQFDSDHREGTADFCRQQDAHRHVDVQTGGHPVVRPSRIACSQPVWTARWSARGAAAD